MKAEKQLWIKAGMVLFLAVYLFLIYSSDHADNVPMDQIAASMEAEESVTSMKKRGRNDLKRYYQLEEDALDGYLFYKAVSPMSVDELLIVRTKDHTQVQAALDSALSHLDSQEKVFQGYGTEQMALLGEAVAESQGNYVIYACGKDAAKWREKFLSLI